MAIPNHHAKIIRDRILGGADADEALSQFARESADGRPLPPRIPDGANYSQEALERRLAVLLAQGIHIENLAGQGGEISPQQLAGNIENFIGFASVPVGVIGPLRIRGTAATGDFYVPLATTEGAMIASYHRGSQVISRSGGAIACCLTESVSRAPCFAFEDLSQAGRFLAWVLNQYDRLQEIVAGTSRFCSLIDLKTTLIGKEVYLGFEFTTGDAAGQNMVTIATEAPCQAVLTGLLPFSHSIGSRTAIYRATKKATMLELFLRAASRRAGRDYGRTRARATDFACRARGHVPLLASVDVGRRAERIDWRAGAFCQRAGGHIPSLWTGRRIAWPRLPVGVTRMDLASDGGLYAAVSLPNLIVGTVGGGTHLPTARECLGDDRLLRHRQGPASWPRLRVATVLAGEISIIAAMAAGQFGQAHAIYTRRKRVVGIGD